MSTPSQPVPSATPASTVDFRLSPRLAVRLMGMLVVVGAATAVTAVVVVAAADLPRVVLTVVVLLLAVGVVAGALLLARRFYVVRLTPDGYRVRFVRGAGVSRGRWADVDDAVTAEVAGARCLVLRLRDGRTTRIPVELLEGSPDRFVLVVRDHLARGRGLRPL